MFMDVCNDLEEMGLLSWRCILRCTYDEGTSLLTELFVGGPCVTAARSRSAEL